MSRSILPSNIGFSRSDFKFEKSHVGIPSGPRGGAEAGERSDPSCDFSNLNFHREKQDVIQQKKLGDPQPNPRYSAKNNDALRMISSVMPNHYLKKSHICCGC